MAQNSFLTTISIHFENLSTELFMSIFDYLSSIEILVTFFDLNKRFRTIVCSYLAYGHRLTRFNFNHTTYSTYHLFCQNILPQISSTITSFQLGSTYHYGQIEYFNYFSLPRLDSLVIILIDPISILTKLENFLQYNRLQWFDNLTIVIDEETKGWDEQMPFCAQNLPVRKLSIIGKAPYVFAQHLMTGCHSITILNIHLKFDHDLLPLLFYLPNLIECHARVDDRGRDISHDLTLLTSLPSLIRFKYEGLMPTINLCRLIIEINQHIQHLIIRTQDYQWPFHPSSSSSAFSSDFFDQLSDLRTFHFYIRVLTSGIHNPWTSSCLIDTKHILDMNRCETIACTISKDIGQIFSLPFAFDHFEIFEKNFFEQIQNEQTSKRHWINVEYLTLHTTIYDPLLLVQIKQIFTKLRSIDYQVLQFSLVPQDNELHQYDIQLDTIKKLVVRDSVKHGCHVPQPLLLLTSHLVELDIDHFYLMQTLSIVGEQAHTRLLSIFARIRRLTVRQFDERLTQYFFIHFPRVQICTLVFAMCKMQIYRDKLPFLDSLLLSMPHLISLKFEHIKKPSDHWAYIEMQKNVEHKLFEYYSDRSCSHKWYDDSPQKRGGYATFLFST